MSKADIATALAAKGITLTASQIKKTPIADLQARLDAASQPKPTRRGMNVAAKCAFKPFREGTKQAALFNLLSRPEGATFDELAAAVPTWTAASVKSALYWDMASEHGVGVRSSFDAGVERFHAVVTHDIATRWRDAHGYTGKGGVVVIFGNKVQSWVSELRDPQHWTPGSIAVDEDGNCHVARGGNAHDGAARWAR